MFLTEPNIFPPKYANLPAHLQAAYQALGQNDLPPPEAPLPPAPAMVC
jgi:hypothetical protein